MKLWRRMKEKRVEKRKCEGARSVKILINFTSKGKRKRKGKEIIVKKQPWKRPVILFSD